MTRKIDRPQLGVALIGAGMIAPTHVAALSSIQTQAQLHTILSRRPERAAYLIEHYAGPRPTLTSDLLSVTENPDIQIAIVATPPSVRIELIDALAKAGKHILLEKPVARTVEEAEHVVNICESAGVELGILFQHRMHPSSRAAAKLIKGGELGRPGLVEIAAPLWREQSYYDELERGTYVRDGGGVLITQAIHTIDLALSLTGPVTRVHAMTATTPLHKMEAEDFAVAGLQFASGAFGSLVASTATFPHGREKITLHYEHGSLHLGRDKLDVFWRDGRCEQMMPNTIGAGENGPIIKKHEWHQAVIEDFIDAVQQGRPPVVTGREALASQRLIQAIEISSKARAPVIKQL